MFWSNLNFKLPSQKQRLARPLHDLQMHLRSHSLVAWAVCLTLEDSVTFHLQLSDLETWSSILPHGALIILSTWDHSHKSHHSYPLWHHWLKSCRFCKVPLLKPAHIQGSLKFTTDHLNDPGEVAVFGGRTRRSDTSWTASPLWNRVVETIS